MQFITGLFGGSGNTLLTMLFALGAVIVLIVLAVWLLKVVFKVSGNSVRGRNRRLSVIDTLILDQKRQLMIVRRDNVEHLILTGGPQDVVVETGIPVEEKAPVAAPPGLRRPVVAPQSARPVVPAGPAPVVEAVRPPAPAPEPRREPETLLEQLQQSGHSGNRKTRVSLRRTGLMRQPAGDQASDETSSPAPAITNETGAEEGNPIPEPGNTNQPDRN